MVFVCKSRVEVKEELDYFCLSFENKILPSPIIP